MSCLKRLLTTFLKSFYVILSKFKAHYHITMWPIAVDRLLTLERKKNVKVHNLGQQICVEKDISVMELQTIFL